MESLVDGLIVQLVSKRILKTGQYYFDEVMNYLNCVYYASITLMQPISST